MTSDGPTSPPDPPVPRALKGRIGKYEILEPIGKGAMGVVYLAHDTILERDVALKLMVPQIADDPELHDRFKREAKAVAKMAHPNVVAVFDLGQHTDGSPYIAMELLKGQDLQKAMRGQPPLTLERKLSIMVQVLAGLAHAHAAGIVHRDIKPANIFLSQDGHPKIMDFGVARVSTASMTGTGNIVGTADYMSPEQVKGAKVDGRSDLFSVGSMLFELLAGRRPFRAESLMAIFYRITHDEPNWELIPGGDDYDALLPILQRALAKDLEARYASAYDFAVDLRNYLISHVTNTSGAHALENLLEGEQAPPSMGLSNFAPTLPSLDDFAPTSAPAATSRNATGPPTGTGTGPRTGPTLAGGGPATLEPGSSSGRSARTQPPAQLPRTQAPRPAAPTGEKRTAAGPRSTARARPAPPPPSRVPLLGGLAAAVLVAGVGGYLWLNRQPPPSPPTPVATVVPTPAASVALPTPEPSPIASATPESVATPPPTPVPQPSFSAPAGKGAQAVAAGQAAFKKGDYVRAVEQAQAALREDSGSDGAQKLLNQALAGQKARQALAAGESALAANDFDGAQARVDEARALAPWDTAVTSLFARIGEARQRSQAQAQVQAQARVGQLLTEAETAVAGAKYDDALKAYDEVLKLEPQNVVARSGKTTVMAARNAGPAKPSGRTFSWGKTVADAGKKAAADLPPGMEPETFKVAKGAQAADLPGKVQFEVSPEGVKPGDRFSVKILFSNEGTAPIPIAGLLVNTTISGKLSGGPIPPRAREVAPGQKATLHEVSGTWSEDYASWSMDVTVSTARGEKYSNKLTCK